VVAEASDMVAPAACYEAFPIEKVLHGQFRLAGGTRIGCGPVWSIREQRTIFRLLDAEEIGGRLLPSFVIEPIKSLTVVFGAGASPMGVEGMTNCDFCSIQDRCRYAAARVSH
jgi:hypothetical protein